ncbi:transport protein Avl9-domain-containing protein, partial [Flagelloscypha sp. PMI_526]
MADASPLASPASDKPAHRFLLDEDAHSDTSINLNSDDEDDAKSAVNTPATSVLASPPPLSPKTPLVAPATPTQSTTTNVAVPPAPSRRDTTSDAASVHSTTSTSRKARPESKVLTSQSDSPLVLGICLVDFDHGEGPRIEWSKSYEPNVDHDTNIFAHPDVRSILPFLALPDGAHLREEDYCIFHMVYPSRGPNPRTIFGMSCTRQIPADELLVKPTVVTRSTVQKSVVVLTTSPLFSVIRDKLGVVTQALFLQRNFSTLAILNEFGDSLEEIVKNGPGSTESGLVFGLNVREMVKTFRHRSLILVKALLLQKRIMFTGHPVERLCTYQYTLASMVPALLQTLNDCGSPPLHYNTDKWLKEGRPTELRTSDRKSMLRYLGLPLDIFGRDAFFQPYLPLQQVDMIENTPSWLCGSTNEMVWSRPCSDIRIDTESAHLTFTNPQIERIVSLTAADRKWMDEIMQAVTESYVQEENGLGGEFKGSDDWLREKFEEYISSFLSTVRYRDFLARSGKAPTTTMADDGSGSTTSSLTDFNPLFLEEFKKTHAYNIWERVTDDMLFDIVEARHPTPAPATIVGDIGLRLQEGMIDLKLDQQLAPARQVLGNAGAGIGKVGAAAGTGLLNAVAGVRGRWAASRATTPEAEVGLKEALGDGPPPTPAPAAAAPPATPSPVTSTLSRFSLPSFTRNRTTSVSTIASASIGTTSPPVTPSTSTESAPPPVPEKETPSRPTSSWGSWIATKTQGTRFPSFGRRESSSSLASSNSNSTSGVPSSPPVHPIDEEPPSNGLGLTASPASGVSNLSNLSAPLSPRLGSVIGNGKGVGVIGSTPPNQSPASSPSFAAVPLTPTAAPSPPPPAPVASRSNSSASGSSDFVDVTAKDVEAESPVLLDKPEKKDDNEVEIDLEGDDVPLTPVVSKSAAAARTTPTPPKSPKTPTTPSTPKTPGSAGVKDLRARF